jgi:ATP-dependent exoDNAse (exonuclease V) beta subunit
MALADQSQRDQALDTTRSFIVQAPAGSGKTELLIQRYLSLLSQSAQPEAVFALTFTRKAATEMRNRILEALHLAQLHSEPPSQTHHRARWTLAKKLYEWQTQRGWNLLLEPHRLQIQTIDACYAQIVQKTPLQSGLNPSTRIAEQPERLYREAVHQLLTHLEEKSALGQALIALARYLNNDHAQIERLLIHMLGHRDQWLFLVQEGTEDFNQLRPLLEQSLYAIHETAIQQLEHAFFEIYGSQWKSEFKSLLAFASRANQAQGNLIPSESQFWISIADILLTKEGQWRHTLTKAQGFPAAQQASSQAEKEEYVTMKAKGMALLAHLRPHQTLRIRLHHIRNLPPIYYTEAQWSVLKSLFHVLSALITILRFTFEQHQMVDYIEISLSALKILGEETQPTETLLQLDYQIQHILIDEFQDTSLQQLRFLQRLTAGWEPSDGRTLFLVGDPMQSIYRFRKAEVRLFTLVQTTGLGHCQLKSLTLSTNFRASLPLITWVNDHFNTMVKQLHQHTGQAIPFVKSTPASASNASHPRSNAVHLCWTPHDQHEIHIIVEQIKEQLPTQATIGILGRTRHHLLPIIQRLRVEKIDYQAVEIETLADRAIIQDLLLLTRALTHLGDNIAWMAFLRAPWCGATLEEMHTVMQACQKQTPTRIIWDQLQHSHELPLHSSTQKRIQYLVNQLTPLIQNYGRLTLTDRIKQAWFKLGGMALQERTQTDIRDIETFFQLLDNLQVGETLVDISLLEERLQAVYTQSTLTSSAQVVIMTMHKAKGLEFDTVILPCLHKTTRHNPYPLILFDETPTAHERHLLMASLLNTNEDSSLDKIYAYLRQHDQAQHHAETLRLFYVACTRAKEKLYLTASLQSPAQFKPLTGSLLYWLWPTLHSEQKQLTHNDSFIAAQPSEHNTPQRLERMHFKPASHLDVPPSFARVTWRDTHLSPPLSNPFEWTLRKILAHLVKKGLTQAELLHQRAQWLAYYEPILKTFLYQAGYAHENLSLTLKAGLNILDTCLQDEKGRWLLSGEHETLSTLYPLLGTDMVDSLTPVIDRIFVDTHHQHWMILYLFNLPPHYALRDTSILHALEIYPTLAPVVAAYNASHSLHIGLYCLATRHWLTLTAEAFLKLQSPH